MSDQEAEEFFAGYRAAFIASDPAALVEHFAFPLQVLSVWATASRYPSRAGTSGWDRSASLLGAYDALAVADAAPLALEVSEPVPGIVSARVRWELRRADGSAVYGFRAVYTLVSVDGGLRIAAIAHDELPRLQQAMARSTR